MAAALVATPNPAKVGDTIVFTGTGVGDPVAAVLTTALAGANNDLTYTAKTPGVAGNSITVRYVVAGNSTALSCTVSSLAITVNLATDSGGVATSTAAQIKAIVDATVAAVALVSVALAASNDGTGVAVALGATNLATGADAVGTTTQIKLIHSGSPGDAIAETVTLAAAGTITSVGDFTYEVDEPGTITAQLVVDAVVKSTVTIPVFSS